MHGINKLKAMMVSKKPTRGYRNWNTNQTLIFGVYLKVRKSFYRVGPSGLFCVC